MVEVILQRTGLMMVFQLVPLTQHVNPLRMTVNKPLSAVLWLVSLAAVASLAVASCTWAVNYVPYITTIAISRARLI